MFRRLLLVLALSCVSLGKANAQVNIDTGLFINQPELDNGNSSFGISFRGGFEDGGPNLGMSVRVGKLLFGLETLTSYDGRQSSFISGGVADGGSMASGFVATHGPMHRAMMGMRITRNAAIYGFHGLSGYSIQNELSYHKAYDVQGSDVRDETVYVEKSYYKGCKRYIGLVPTTISVPYTFEATHSSYGFNSASFDGVRNSIGAGMEAFLFGGVLRLEYNMVHMNGFTQTAKLNHSTSDARLANTNEEDSFSYSWKGSTEQLIQMRWKASF